ncbi:DUF4180 domain-containing protein [Devosia sp.]|uniref:DUF4180 domain-containing protein n=1 Tax=Devosia sp. TaxID=1871048 RepID=UPI003A8F6345
MQIETIGATRVLIYDGPVLASEADAGEVMGETFGTQIDMVALPVELLAPEFFQLSTGLAGALLQKLVTYGLRVAIVGDCSEMADQSQALTSFIAESNRGAQVWFVADDAALAARLASVTGAS